MVPKTEIENTPMATLMEGIFVDHVTLGAYNVKVGDLMWCRSSVGSAIVRVTEILPADPGYEWGNPIWLELVSGNAPAGNTKNTHATLCPFVEEG